MFKNDSFINTISEYAHDWELYNSNDMLLRETASNNIVIIHTQYGHIVVTKDTLLMNDKGLWVRALSLNVGDALKHYTMNISVVTGITIDNTVLYPMYKIVDCKGGYLIVNNFYISCDV